jgi:hypothetical protein
VLRLRPFAHAESLARESIRGSSLQLVLVEWIDSRRGEGWTRLEDLLGDCAATKCKSVGWIIAKNTESLTLAGHLGENPDQCCGDMTIPLRSVIRITDMQTVSRRRRSIVHLNQR